MANDLATVSQGNICRFRLGFGSFVRFLARFGFYVGISSVPFLYLLVYLTVRARDNPIPSTQPPSIVATILIGMPIMGIISFAFYAVLAYPLYRWLKSPIYVGEFEMLQQSK